MQQGKENEMQWVQWVDEPLMKTMLAEKTSLVLRVVRFAAVRRPPTLLAVFWDPWRLVTTKFETGSQMR
jgi:hypothetical protein